MAPDSLTEAAGLRGWVAQGQPTQASRPGFHGWVAQGQPTRATPPGLHGWVATQPDNLVLTVITPPDQVAADHYLPLTLELHHAGTMLRTLVLTSGGRYVLRVPPGVSLTLLGHSPRYAPLTQALLLAPGEIKEVSITLAFTDNQALVSKTRRRYLAA